ncbi:MAG: hypothetical protein KF860_13700 [Cyclobacteriaceae bacterium]|nr:hypothetical protein [Cyclobacteriaceae bacterium]
MRASLVVIVLFISVISGISQCNEYYQLSNGSEWEMESYNAKGKLTGKQSQKVIDFTSGANSFSATVNSVVFDQKNKELMQGDLKFECKDGTMVVDMRNFINEEQMKAFQSYEMQIESDNLEIPNNLTVGQTLKDGTITITTANSPIPMTMSVKITNRKVVGKESITTPAGTFECYKITSKSTVNTKMGIGMTFNYTTVEWLAPKVAVVKSESYRNDKLQGYSLLTKRN